MGLTKYRDKRSFTETPEPKGGKSEDSDLKFVIQKHAASHLHYDFRLEMRGVLKSWAVPKGPSTDPSVKRLAMMVEDHPYDYRNFEGIIPKGQYGGGTVIVWDEGTYSTTDEEPAGDKKSAEKILMAALEKGKIKIIMKGRKLKGEYALVRSHGREENAWLLMKVKDKYASVTDITKKEKSVLSGKTLKQVAATSENIYGQAKEELKEKKRITSSKKSAGEVQPDATSANVDLPTLLKKGIKKAQPADLAPMLATLTDKPFDAPGWLYEIKWDGYRALAYTNKKTVELASRNNKSFNEKFYPIVTALRSFGMNAVLDGEVIVADEKGMANFGDLQNWRSEADGNLLFYVFDILWYEGKDLTHLPLTERRAILKAILPESDNILLSNDFETSGLDFFDAAEKMGLEGIMAKKADSAYNSGGRTTDWLKVKTAIRHEVVIGGYTKNEGTAKPFSSLLVGVYEKGKLVYSGKIGTGFNDKTQKEMMALFKPHIISESPFSTVPDINQPSRFRPVPPKATATWLKPVLVCEVAYRELTTDGIMRHPSFQGMRIDKAAKAVGRDKVVKQGELKDEKGKKEKKVGLREQREKEVKGGLKVKQGEQGIKKGLREQRGKENKEGLKDKQGEKGEKVKQDGKVKNADVAKYIKAPKAAERKTLLNPTDETQVRKINGKEIKFSNLNKIYWPKENITKREFLNYYYRVAPYILPWLKDRPQSMNRFPNGITGKSFYQKDVTGKVPDWVETFPYVSEGIDKKFMLCNDEAALLYMASLGCIEMNPWSSTYKKPDNPDWCVIDLDPDKNHFDKVIETALVTKEILDAAGADSYCKTSGSTGLHIYIPLGKKYDYEASKEFARLIAHLVNERLPKFTSIERMTAKRRGKLYIDFLQNRPQATLAAAYSVRPKPGATVSMPLHWEEVKKGLKMTDFTIHNAPARLAETGDIFKPVLGKGINMEKVLKKISEE
ncbi:MAG: non-homologous end-joining DNA ligase [Ferruginibacter sp.]